MLKELTEVEIGEIGERYTIEWLKENGHTIIQHDTRSPGSTDIETDKWLVQVKTSVWPKEPAELTPDEKRNIKSRATKLERVAYLSRVTLDEDGSKLDIRITKP